MMETMVWATGLDGPDGSRRDALQVVMIFNTALLPGDVHDRMAPRIARLSVMVAADVALETLAWNDLEARSLMPYTGTLANRRDLAAYAASAIAGAFSWSATPEGHAYWAGVCQAFADERDRLKKLISAGTVYDVSQPTIYAPPFPSVPA